MEVFYFSYSEGCLQRESLCKYVCHSEWQLGNEYRKLCKREQIGYLREIPCRNDSEIKTETFLLQHLCDKKKCSSVWLKFSVGSGCTDLKYSNWCLYTAIEMFKKHKKVYEVLKCFKNKKFHKKYLLQSFSCCNFIFFFKKKNIL